jgi:hypothetical protein
MIRTFFKAFNLTFLVVYLTAGVWTGCSNVAFENAPKPACNGFNQNCSTTTINNHEYNAFDYTLTVPQPQVDILFVDDNSRSMYAEQTRMGERFPNFLSALNSTDWRIGITTTDINAEGGNLLEFAPGLRILTPSTGNKETLFNNTIRRSEVGSGDERGIYSANVVVDRRGSNGFFRNDAHLAVVVLSDEDERSNGGSTPTYPLEAYDLPQVFKDNVTAKLGASKTLSVHSVIIRPGDQACLDAQNEQTNRGYYGTVYAQLTSLTNGVLGNICETDYGAQLTTIGNQIAKNISSFKLACVPASGPGLDPTITVTPPSASNATLRDDTVYFDPPLPVGAQVHIQYKCAVN